MLIRTFVFSTGHSTDNTTISSKIVKRNREPFGLPLTRNILVSHLLPRQFTRSKLERIHYTCFTATYNLLGLLNWKQTLVPIPPTKSFRQCLNLELVIPLIGADLVSFRDSWTLYCKSAPSFVSIFLHSLSHHSFSLAYSMGVMAGFTSASSTPSFSAILR
jgi:hypothetical protein